MTPKATTAEAPAAPMTTAEAEDRLATRITELEREIADLDSTLAALTLADARGEDAAGLPAAIKRRDAAAGELSRLHAAGRELDRQTAAERHAAECRERLDLVRQYIAKRERVDALNLAMLQAIEAMVEESSECRELGREAASIGLRLGFHDERGTVGPKHGYLATAMQGVMQAAPRHLAAAREGITKSWKVSASGKQAIALEASGGETV